MSPNARQTGSIPQSSEGLSYGDIYNNKITLSDGPLSKDFQPPELILEKRAKQTSFITASYVNSLYFLILENALVDLIAKYDVAEFQTWKLNVIHQGIFIDKYRLFRISTSYAEKVIDFNHSVFTLLNMERERIGEYMFKNFEEYINFKNKKWNEGNLRMFYKTLVLDFSNLDKDMIRLSSMPFHGPGYYVSERLKEAILSAGFTGMAFTEIQEKYPDIKGVYRT